MSSGAWVRTAADALTAIAAAAGAGVGGAWAYFRYRREDPDTPRVNTVVSAAWFHHAGHDYLSIDVELRHVTGARLRIERGAEFETPKPILEVYRLTAAREPTAGIRPVLVSSTEVFVDDTELDSGEMATDHKIVPVGAADPEVLAYELILRVNGGWDEQSWTWCTNAIVRVGDVQTVSGETTRSAPAG